MDAEIISIGTELLLGEIVDTNSTHIARVLRTIGVNLFFTTTVGDNEQRITTAISTALDRADIVITTGGLGPTVDDVTRQAAAAATGRELVFQQDLLDQIAERFARFGSRMSDNNRQQAYIPAGAIPVENPVGTAPCFIVESERGVVISLPGVPREMKYQLDAAILPYLRDRFQLTSIIKARILRTAGIGESSVDEAIDDLMRTANPTVGLAAHIGQVDIRITAKAEEETEADRLIADMEAQIRERVGAFIYGTEKETIEAALVAALKQHGMKASLCEVGFGGKLRERLEAVPGGADVLAGAAQFDSLLSLHKALDLRDPATPQARGEAAARWLHAQYHAPISIILIGEEDATSITIATPEAAKTRIYRFGQQDARPVIWASSWGLAHAWRWLSQQA